MPAQPKNGACQPAQNGSRSRLGILVLLAMASGCGPRTEPPGPMAITRVVPEVSARPDRPGRLFLNSRITVFFTDDLDPLSVTSDTIRLTRVDGGAAARVDFEQVRVGRRSITLVPRPPLDAALSDGSLQPSALYRLELPGFPLTNTVATSDGRNLRQGMQAWFRTVSRNPKDPNFSTPFLPVGTGAERFELRGRYKKLAHMAAGSGRMKLHFSLPPYPASATPKAFEVIRLRASEEKKTVAIRGVYIRSFAKPIDPHPGCSVELEFADPGDVQVDDLLYVKLERENGLVDYRGRPLHQKNTEYFWVRIHPSPRVSLLDLPDMKQGTQDFAALDFEPTRADYLGFQASKGAIVVQSVMESGGGQLGVFHPRKSMTIESGKPFDRGDGQIVRANEVFDFQAIRIPKGVTVTLRADRPLRVLSVGNVRIDGTLQLDIAMPDGGVGAVDTLRLQDLPTCTPLTLITGGDIHVLGRILQSREVGESQGALALVTSGTVHLPGDVSRIPVRTILSAERVVGTVQGPLLARLALTPGAVAPARAEAWTDWLPLPKDHPARLLVQARATGVEVHAQFASPSPLNPRLPYLAGLASPLAVTGVGATTTVRRGSFVRFRLRAIVSPGAALPSVQRLLVETDAR